MAMDTPNVYCESGWCFQSRIVEFAEQLGKEKIVFGTDSPPNDPGMWLRELEVLCHEPPQGLGISEEQLEGYLGNNIARLVGIDPTPPPKDLKDAEARLKDSYANVKRAEPVA